MNKPQTRDEWQARAKSLQIRTQAFINGQYVDAASGKTFDCISPADGRVIAQVAECEEEDGEMASKLLSPIKARPVKKQTPTQRGRNRRSQKRRWCL